MNVQIKVNTSSTQEMGRRFFTSSFVAIIKAKSRNSAYLTIENDIIEAYLFVLIKIVPVEISSPALIPN